MAAGVGSPEHVRVAGIAMDFPASDETSFVSPPRVPPRLRRRLVESRSLVTAEEIEAKLRDADRRRQQFYERLSSKARRKLRSPSRSSSNEGDLGQRLEAKLQAAEQKRYAMILMAESALMRLARLDELRQAAKIEAQTRFEKERKKLGTKVDSRVQQAEENRILIQKAHRQRRATLKERTSQSLLRRMVRENKYKERVCAAIHQKRAAAAEKKRLELLEAEKKRTCAQVMQVRRVAKSVSHQREIERRRIKDQLEDRLQRAMRQRAEYLRHRGRLHSSLRVNLKMHKQADLLSRKLARCWRRFLKQKGSTLTLAKAFDALKINEEHIKSMPFEQLALLIESTATLETVKALLDRLECRFKLSQNIAATTCPSSWNNIDHLLKRVASPKRKGTPRTPSRIKETKKHGSNRSVAKIAAKLSRYQVRVVLCAYMILGHPDAVFSGQGERELALAQSAASFVREFELLMKIILDGPILSSDDESDPTLPKRLAFRSQLVAFDEAWCSYLNCFVVWKVKDAQSLEEDLVRAACQLELSMIQTCKMTPDGGSGTLTHDMKAIQKQVTEDQKLLREKVEHLSGGAGIERMECALTETRSKYFLAMEKGTPIGSPVTQFFWPTLPSSSDAHSVASHEKKSNQIQGNARSSHVVRSLFREDTSAQARVVGPSSPGSSLDSQLDSSTKKLVAENELIINELIHEQKNAFVDGLSIASKDQRDLTTKIKETMEKAFWDGIMESMKEEEPNYDRVVELMREVRDEICNVAPQSWKSDIVEAIDLDILSQVLKSGNLDTDYLGKILEYALVTLQKLSAPANEGEMKAMYEGLMKELTEICETKGKVKNSHVIAMIKGLRFVLEQIQELKQEISKARIRMIKPLLKGHTGFDYLKNAFVKHYGSPSDAFTSLPLTAQWISSVWHEKDQEWNEHKNSLLVLTNGGSSYEGHLPSATLRTGGSLVVNPNGNHTISVTSPAAATGSQQPGCKGEKVDLLVRLGLLKLVSGIPGITQECLPETLKLNLNRLRAVQAQVQKIIVISTSVLVFRQILMSELPLPNPVEMENMVVKCGQEVSELLDWSEEAGIEEIVEVMSRFSRDSGEASNIDKLQGRKAVMSRVLVKSLQAGDAVFERVSRAVYLAARGAVLAGNGTQGRKLAETALRRVGAINLTERVVAAAEILVAAATVSVNVHGQWYAYLTDNM